VKRARKGPATYNPQRAPLLASPPQEAAGEATAEAPAPPIATLLFTPAIDDGWMLVIAGSRRFEPGDAGAAFELVDALVLQLQQCGVVTPAAMSAAVGKLASFLSGDAP
jgi:hypothetical protein